MAMIAMVAAWFAAAGIGLWWWRANLERPSTAAAEQAPRSVPERSLDPRKLSGANGKQLWMLRSDPQCTNSVKLSGRRVRGDRAISLFTLGCQPARCSCHYQRVSDPRRRLRRLASDRREEIRFSTSSNDRRLSNDRRSDALAWSDAPYAR